MAVVVASYNYKCDREFGLRTAVVRWCVCVSALVLSFKPQPHVPGAASWRLLVLVCLRGSGCLGLGRLVLHIHPHNRHCRLLARPSPCSPIWFMVYLH